MVTSLLSTRKVTSTCCCNRSTKDWAGRTAISDGSLATTLAERKVLAHQPDWPQALAFSPDGGSFAVGRYDGSFSLYDASSFEEIRGLWPASGGEGL